VADYSGSHVVVRNTGKDRELEESVLVKAAQLAPIFHKPGILQKLKCTIQKGSK
jgi:predicted ribosome quality control (RQC) complex YloA/Tae2 family protein